MNAVSWSAERGFYYDPNGIYYRRSDVDELLAKQQSNISQDRWMDHYQGIAIASTRERVLAREAALWHHIDAVRHFPSDGHVWNSYDASDPEYHFSTCPHEDCVRSRQPVEEESEAEARLSEVMSGVSGELKAVAQLARLKPGDERIAAECDKAAGTLFDAVGDEWKRRGYKLESWKWSEACRSDGQLVRDAPEPAPLRALVETWRAMAKDAHENQPSCVDDDPGYYGRWAAIEICADELSAALDVLGRE